MKKFGALALSLALTASLSVPALAAEDTPLLISPNPNAATDSTKVVPISAALSYNTALVLNGETLDTSAIPAPAVPNLLPMRLVAESDHGSAYWSEEENQGYFYLEGSMISVNFADNTIMVDDAAVDGAAVVVNGVTFIPAEVLGALEGYTVHTNSEQDVSRIDITTPNNDPMIKLAYSILESSNMARGMKGDISVFAENYTLPEGTFTQGVTFFGMNTTPDCLILGKLSEGADVDAVKAAMESYRQQQQETFSWYLPQNLPKVEAAQTVVSGDYILFLIAEDATKGVELFNAFVAAQQ